MNNSDAIQLHHDSVIIDRLNASYFLDERVLTKLRQGGVTAVNATVAAWHPLTETINMIADLYAFLERHADQVMQIRTVADIAAPARHWRLLRHLRLL